MIVSSLTKKATRKAKKDEENPEIDEIVAELSREVATDADEKIAAWMRGNVEAADVVAALTKKAEAESKCIHILHQINS
jgi:predicted methyltransferase MtxX (methanogen marker protein 4)